MIKIKFFLLSILVLSCGGKPKAVEKETVSSEVLTAETVSQTDTSKEAILSSEKTVVEEVSETLTTPLEKKMPDSVVKPSENIEKKPRANEKEIAPISNEVEPAKKNAVVETVEKITEAPIKQVQEKIVAVSQPDHSVWNSLLVKFVNAKGDVNYKAFKTDALNLDNYLTHLAENSPETNWSKNKKLAYYINLYNAATVKLILDNYPTESIKDIKNPWGKEWVKTGDGLISLGDIEHKILRKMNEPRIHFAINCASFSCPRLLNEAFTEAKMEKQLEAMTFDFVNDSSKNIVSEEKMELSNLFKWYKKDFTENGSLADYIKPYTKVEISSDTDISYLKYDWNLNESK